jgi:membrane protein involved in colicin uptake
MCLPKPGPRCASHLKADIATYEKSLANRIAENNIYGDGVESGKKTINELRFEYSGTRTGQKELLARIATETHPRAKQQLQDLQELSLEAYNEKKAAYAVWKKQNNAESEVAKKRANALKILDADATKSINSAAKKAKTAKATAKAKAEARWPSPAPAPSYTSYSYSGKGGK